MTFNAFEISPVPTPGPGAIAPEPFRGIYGMPAFATITTDDAEASLRFWTALGFFDLFSIPGRLTHLRRWAFQDVLLTPGRPSAGGPTLSFACVESEVDALAAACHAAGFAVDGPADTPWNTRDFTVLSPEGVRVTFTAAKPWDAEAPAATGLAAVGITHPDADRIADTSVHADNGERD